MNDFGLEDINKQPCAISTIRWLLKIPSSFVSNGILIEPLGGVTTGLSNVNSEIAEAPVELGKIHFTCDKPLLQF